MCIWLRGPKCGRPLEGRILGLAAEGMGPRERCPGVHGRPAGFAGSIVRHRWRRSRLSGCLGVEGTRLTGTDMRGADPQPAAVGRRDSELPLRGCGNLTLWGFHNTSRRVALRKPVGSNRP